ncbi:DUF1385 domain-containing protein [Rubrobacter xylanophilus]|uniref:DUF1385 domain-containing protein n=1 Tax=Rubrobacter xylanophilus TaxID=49319 RepID=UPI001C642580|nr:DUF1385 domain-containing protein [Rubrobacter xylanophilus]
MEGVLMRSPNFWGMAVRTPEGELDLRAERFRSVTRKSRFFRLPVIRGFLSLAETLWLGMRALTISTNIALGEEEELSRKEIAATLLLALGLGVVLFLVAPVLGTKGIGALAGGIEHPVLFNLVEGVIRVAIFVAYLLIITAASRDIKRFFAYHGAEHKAIKVYERGEELVPENARKLDTSHVRCGTSFILYVLVLSILVFSLLGVEGWLYMVASRVVVIPLVAGLAFEFIMWSARHQDSALVRALVWPGLQLQKLTTREPTDEMVEVAMASLKKVLAMEEEARIRPDETNKLVI